MRSGLSCANTLKGSLLRSTRPLRAATPKWTSLSGKPPPCFIKGPFRPARLNRIVQRRALGEGKLHDILVGFASADDAVVRPNRIAHPLPLLDDVRVCFLDGLAHSAGGFPAPVPEFGDSFRDELRCRLALARARLFHILILEVPDIFHLQDKSLGFPPLCALPLARARTLCGCDPWNQAGTAMESNNGPLLHFSAANSPVVFLDYSLKNFRCG